MMSLTWCPVSLARVSRQSSAWLGSRKQFDNVPASSPLNVILV